MPLLYDIMNDDNINIAIILKTAKSKNIIKFWRQKIFGQIKFICVLIAELSCAIGSDTFLRDLSVLSTCRPNEQNHSTSTLYCFKMLFGRIKTVVASYLDSNSYYYN